MTDWPEGSLELVNDGSLWEPVPPVDTDDMLELAMANIVSQEMIALAKRENGVGLAGPQVGVPKRICVVRLGADARTPGAARWVVMLNPEWTIDEENAHIPAAAFQPREEYEGCLSMRDMTARGPRSHVMPVTRVEHGFVTYRALDGRRARIRCFGFDARVVQHEIDHLDGVVLDARTPRGEFAAARIECESCGWEGYDLKDTELEVTPCRCGHAYARYASARY